MAAERTELDLVALGLRRPPEAGPSIPAPAPRLVGEVLDRTRKLDPEREALVGRHGRYSYAELDRDTYQATIQEAARLAVEVLHPINAPGDVTGCTLDADGNVTTPKGYDVAWKRMAEGGWIAPAAPGS